MPDPAWTHAYHRKIWRFGRIFIPIWIAGVLCFAVAAAADQLLDLRWGYQWRDALGALGMAIFVVLFWFAWNWMFKLMRWLTERFIGPDPDAESDS